MLERLQKPAVRCGDLHLASASSGSREPKSGAILESQYSSIFVSTFAMS